MIFCLMTPAAFAETGAEIDRIEKGNNGDETVDAELTVPDNAKSVSLLLYAAPNENNEDDWIGFALQMYMTVDGKENASGVLGSQENDKNSTETTESEDGESDIADWAMEEQEDADSVSDAIEGVAKAAVKVIAILGALGIGAVVAIIALIKKSATKKAAKAGAKAVGKATAKAVSNKASVKSKAVSGSTDTGSGGVGDSYVVTDPATGAQTLYVKDAAGNWVSSDGGSVLDIDRLSDWKDSRSQDRVWQDKSNENMKKPTRFEEIDRNEAIENKKIERETYEEKIAIRHGMDASDKDAVYEKISCDQEKAEVEGQKWQDRADNFDTAVEVAENLRTTADYAVNALGAVTGPAGTVVKIYSIFAF